MSGEESRLLAFLRTIVRPGAVLDQADPEDLVGSGLIDSLAVLEIIGFLEAEFGVDFSSTGVDPIRLTSIPAILQLIEHHGR